MRTIPPEAVAPSQHARIARANAGPGLRDDVPEPLFDGLVRVAARLFACPLAAIALIDDDRQRFKATLGLGREETPIEGSFSWHVVNGDAPLIVADARADATFRDLPLVTEAPHVRYYVGAPIRVGDLALGALFVGDAAPRAETHPADVAALADLASVVGELMANHAEGRTLRRMGDMLMDAR